MTREETIKLIGVITMAYPNFDKFKDENHIRSMVAVWADIFSEDNAGLVGLAVKQHISTSKWPPSIAEIRELMTRIQNPDIIPPDEAWAVVSKYLSVVGEYCHRDYHRELPAAIAETIDAIGYGQLYSLHVAYARGSASKAGLDRVTFLQAYEEKVERQRKQAMLPPSLRQKIEAVSAAQSDGSRRLIEGVNRQWQEQQDYYNRPYSFDRLEKALGSADDRDRRRLEEAQTRAIEAREETYDDE